MLDKITYLETKTEKYPMAFTLNVIEALQEKYGNLNEWTNLAQNSEEPDIKALKFFMTEAINEGIEIENEKRGEKRKLLTHKQVGRILTEVGFTTLTDKIRDTVSESVQIDDSSKNALPTKNQTEK